MLALGAGAGAAATKNSRQAKVYGRVKGGRTTRSRLLPAAERFRLGCNLSVLLRSIS